MYQKRDFQYVIFSEPEPDPVADADEFLKNGLSYDLKVRKIIRPKKPKKTEAYVPSVKRALQVAKPGASYNPDLNDYMVSLLLYIFINLYVLELRE